MTLISGHCLNSVFGTNAAGLRLRLQRRDVAEPALADTPIVELETGPDGRFKAEVDVSTDDPATTYELVYETGAHLANEAISALGNSIMPISLVSVQFPDRDAHYHFSMAFTPGSFTMLAVVL